MTDKQKQTAFDYHYNIVTKDWTPKSKKGFRNLYRNVWMNAYVIGYDQAEREIKAKADKILEQFGI